MKKMKKHGFTLIEMIIVIAIGFIIILLVYQTMQSTLAVSQHIREKMTDIQRTNFFLETFSSRLMSALVDSENNSFSSTSITFELNEYRIRKIVSYSTEINENGRYDLLVKEKDVFLDTEFSYPAIVDLDRVEFSFFDGESWQTNWEKESFPKGIAISIERKNSKLFFPVMLNIQSAQQS
ncbi:MAG: prepilin-type N-terminal cleavage/methylation domain-containing protein [bacterium]|nr:prepilin-type N-terminal cleavage/methylation domain-containing protein [bacterium]